MIKRIASRLLSATILSSALLAPVVAAAQDGAPADPAAEEANNDIVVTGIRQSLQAARDVKRNAVQFVDAIVADDIGKLPDTNVAESLSRVSGVQVERGIGEGTDISIRGLRENVILYNGRQIFDSTGRGGNGLDQLGGSTYGLLALVPSELISRLSVTKLAGSEEISGALGGVVDVQTRLPLAEKQNLAMSAALTYDELAEKPGFELFGLASTRFAGDTIGVLVTASYSERTISQQGLDTFSGYLRYNDTTVTPSRFRFGNSDVRAQEVDEDRRKLGLSGVIQWQPSDRVELTLDTFYSQLSSDRNRYWLSFNPTQGLTGATYSDNDVLLTGRAAGPVLSNTEIADVTSDVWSSALRGKFELSDMVTARAELSHGTSSADYRQIYFRLQPITSITPTIDFDFTQGGFGAFDINGIDMADPSQLRFTILFDQLFRAKTDTLAARSDWTVAFDQSFVQSLDFGARYSDLDTFQNPLRADIRPAGGIVASQLGGLAAVRSNRDFLPGEFEGLTRSYLVATSAVTGCGAFTAFPSVSQNAQCLDPSATINSRAGTFRVKERFLEGYGKLNFDTDLGGAALTGNVGVRYIDRRMDSIGNVISGGGVATPTVFERSDGEWLPSGTAKLSVGDNLVLRLGAAKVVAFPNTEDLNNGITLNNNAVFAGGVQISPGTGTGGAPDLDPFRANQFDASIEYYFGRDALVSLGLFYKDVSSFIVQRQSAERYDGVDFLINRKVNGDGAEVKGAEALVQLPFYFLSEPLDGFGVIATYSYIDSQTPVRDVNGTALSFPGLSKNNINLIGYYEKGPFSARLAYNWRDEFLLGLSAAATGIYNDAYSDLAATVRYDFSENASLNIEGINLLDSELRSFDGSPEALRTNVVFGRVFKATVSVRF